MKIEETKMKKSNKCNDKSAGREENTDPLIFYTHSTYLISSSNLSWFLTECKHNERMDRHTDGQVQTNMPLNCSKSGPLEVETSFFRRPGVANTIVSGPFRPQFKLMQVLMHDHVTSNFKNDLINTGSNRAKVETYISDAKGQLTL